MPAQAARSRCEADGRKVVYSSLKPADLLRGANAFTGIALAVIVYIVFALIGIVSLVVRVTVKVIKKKKKKIA